MRSPAVERLRAGLDVNDAAFDDLYPKEARRASKQHWTPVSVARRAAELLVVRPRARVLDVGAGVGKFCLVGALTTDGVFTGVEQRLHFVEVAKEVVRRCKVGRCSFLHGNMTALDWSRFDAFYLFNPFAEHLLTVNLIDDTLDPAPEQHRGYVAFVQEALSALPTGARTVTYWGFGGEMPPGWEIELSEIHRSGPLELWVKRI